MEIQTWMFALNKKNLFLVQLVFSLTILSRKLWTENLIFKLRPLF